MKRICSLLLAFVLAAAFGLTGCARIDAADLMAGVEAAEWPEIPTEPAEAFLSSLNGFAWDLLQTSAEGNPGNILMSPASVYLALAMTLNGADTTTREAMLETLAARGLSVSDINEACRNLTVLLSNADDKLRLNMANSIWYRTGFDADPAFLQANADFFAAGARMLDFDKPEAVDIINGWVKTATEGKIEKILEKIDPGAVMYLINTIYFKADWQTPFIKNYTLPGEFSAPEGTVTANFMHKSEAMAYLELDGSTGVVLPYTGGQFAFMAVLPPDGSSPRQLLQAQNSTFLARLLATGETRAVDLALPAFKTDYSDSLLDELDKMGMGIAFGGSADFSLMNSSRSKNLFISEVKHKTFIDLNENGTEAAAATLVEISKNGLPSGDITLTFDRPFLYGIIDLLTGLPVFIGVMENPEA